MLVSINKDYDSPNGTSLYGEGDVHDAQEWLIQCEVVEKRKVGIHQLTKDALYWWENQRKVLNLV